MSARKRDYPHCREVGEGGEEEQEEEEGRRRGLAQTHIQANWVEGQFRVFVSEGIRRVGKALVK